MTQQPIEQQPPAPSLANIDFHYYWVLLRRHYLKVLGLAVFVTFICYLFLLTLTPIYQSTASILIKSEDVTAVSIGEVVGVDYKRLSYYDTQYNILKSSEVARRVVDKLNLTEHPQFNPKPKSDAGFSFKNLLGEPNEAQPQKTSKPLRESVAQRVRAGIIVSPLPNTQIVNVSYQSSDSKLARDITNAIAEAYIENHMASKLETTHKASSWLQERSKNLKQQLLNSEAALQDFKEQEQLIDVEGIKSLQADELVQLTKKLVDIRQQKTRLKNTYQQIESLKGRPIDEIIVFSSIIQQPLVQSLKAQETKAAANVAELSKRYGKKHPRLIAAKNEWANIQDALKNQVFNSIDSQKKEYQILTQFEDALKKQISQAKKEYQRLERKSFNLNTLKRDVESNRKLYDLFLNRAKETMEAAGFAVPHARILETATAASSPIKPNKKLALLATFFISLLLAAALVVLYELLDNTIKTPSDVEDKLHSPLLGLLPLVKENENSLAFTGFIDDKQNNFSEAIRTIRTVVLLSTLDVEKPVFVVSSSIPNEGKSTVAINLGSALGQIKNTLIIDADMRRPTLAKTFADNIQQPGLSELVAGSASIDDCIIQSESAGASFLFSGLVPSNPLELLSSTRFKEVLAKLRQQFDCIVIDSPPTQSVSDSLLLASMATGVIYVVKSDSTSKPLVEKGLKRLKSANGNILGVVLNQVDTDDKHYQQYSYESGYYQYQQEPS